MKMFGRMPPHHKQFQSMTLSRRDFHASRQKNRFFSPYVIALVVGIIVVSAFSVSSLLGKSAMSLNGNTYEGTGTSDDNSAGGTGEMTEVGARGRIKKHEGTHFSLQQYEGALQKNQTPKSMGMNTGMDRVGKEVEIGQSSYQEDRVKSLTSQDSESVAYSSIDSPNTITEREEKTSTYTSTAIDDEVESRTDSVKSSAYLSIGEGDKLTTHGDNLTIKDDDTTDLIEADNKERIEAGCAVCKEREKREEELERMEKEGGSALQQQESDGVEQKEDAEDKTTYAEMSIQQKRTKKRILVTGGAGFVGSHLVDRLLARGDEVIVIDNFFTGRKQNLIQHKDNPNLEIIRHDVVDPFMAEVDQIYHLACPASPVHYKYNPVKTVKTNVMGTMNMLGLARRTRARFLLTSTSEVYGDPLQHPQNETYWGNVNPIGERSCYDEGKRTAETLTFDYQRQMGLEVRVARIFNTYGPRMGLSDGRVVSNFVRQALKGENITIYGDGSQTRSFQYVDDLVNGLITLMDNDEHSGPFNIGNPGEFTMNELAEVVKDLVDEDAKVLYVPNTPDDPSRRRPDITKAKKLLGWEPIIKLREGLPAMVADFKERIKADAKDPEIRTTETRIGAEERVKTVSRIYKNEMNSKIRTKKRILVTGGAGFVGSHLVDRLLARGDEVIVIDNFFTGRKQNLIQHKDNPNLEIIRHDVVDPFMAEVDQIYHLACPASPVHYKYNPVKTVKTNVMGTMNMLGLARRTRARFLLTSTSEVYGDPLQHPQNETYWGNVNPIGERSCYDEGKRTAETLTFDYQRQMGLEVRVARIFNTYGPRMGLSDGRVVSNFVRQALKGENITIYGDGSQTRSFQYVDDLVNGLITLMDNDEHSGPFNIGNPGEFTMNELAEVVKDLVDEDAKVLYVPNTPDDPSRRRPDITKAKKLLGWEPIIKLREGLPAMVADFKERIKADAKDPEVRTPDT